MTDVSPQMSDSNLETGENVSEGHRAPTVTWYFMLSLPAHCVALESITVPHAFILLSTTPSWTAPVFLTSQNPSGPTVSHGYFERTNEWNEHEHWYQWVKTS